MNNTAIVLHQNDVNPSQDVIALVPNEVCPINFGYQGEECVFIDFFAKGINALIIQMNNLSQEEHDLFMDAPVKFGINKTTKGGLNLNFNFSGFAQCATFNSKFLKRDELPFINVKGEKLLVTLILIDPATNVIQAMRAFTLHPISTVELFSAIEKQHGMDVSIERISFANQHFDSISLNELSHCAVMRKCGM